MAKTLSDALKQSRSALGTSQATTGLLQAKTGKAAPGTGAPMQSSLAERAGVAKAETALTQEAGRQALTRAGQAQQMRGIEATEAQRLEDIAIRREGAEKQLDQATTKILGELDRAKKSDSAERESMALEQLGFLQGMNDKKYIADLQDQGRRQRLTDKNRFEVELQKDIFREEEGMFENEQQFLDMMQMDEHEFNKMLTQMNINDTHKLYKEQQKAQARAAVVSAIGTGAGIAASHYGEKAADEGWFSSGVGQEDTTNLTGTSSTSQPVFKTSAGPLKMT